MVYKASSMVKGDTRGVREPEREGGLVRRIWLTLCLSGLFIEAIIYLWTLKTIGFIVNPDVLVVSLIYALGVWLTWVSSLKF